MQEALFYRLLKNNAVRCDLCPWNCIVQEGQFGNCRVRINKKGKLFTDVFNKVAALGIDPIEKKPLYHFYPGRNILSIGEVGCNLHCTFCQNHRISQCFSSEFKGYKEITPLQIVEEALKTYNNIGIAYTYNEPFTFYEFMLETAKLAHQNGLKNVVVSNGYVNPEPLQAALPLLDAFNIDLKAFTTEFYRKYTKGKLEPVMQTLKTIAKNNVHLEITNLVIPELNDDESQFKKMINWIASELGPQVPLHISRYFPQYEMKNAPTPVSKLEKLYDVAKKQLHHVYLGNVSDAERSTTFCPNCNKKLISRERYNVITVNITKEGNCKSCGNQNNIVLS